MRQVLLTLILGLWVTTAGAEEKILLAAGTPACHSVDKIKTALEKNNLSINDCGFTRTEMLVEKKILPDFSFDGLTFQLVSYSFSARHTDGDTVKFTLYGFSESTAVMTATLPPAESE